MGFVVIDPSEEPPTLVLDYATWIEYTRLNAEVNLQIAKSAATGETFISRAFLVLPEIENESDN
jgi:hypothetical protein